MYERSLYAAHYSFQDAPLPHKGFQILTLFVCSHLEFRKGGFLFKRSDHRAWVRTFARNSFKSLQTKPIQKSYLRLLSLSLRDIFALFKISFDISCCQTAHTTSIPVLLPVKDSNFRRGGRDKRSGCQGQRKEEMGVVKKDGGGGSTVCPSTPGVLPVTCSIPPSSFPIPLEVMWFDLLQSCDAQDSEVFFFLSPFFFF